MHVHALIAAMQTEYSGPTLKAERQNNSDIWQIQLCHNQAEFPAHKTAKKTQ